MSERKLIVLLCAIGLVSSLYSVYDKQVKAINKLVPENLPTAVQPPSPAERMVPCGQPDRIDNWYFPLIGNN